MLLIFKLLISFSLFADSYTNINNIYVTSDQIEQYDIKKDLNEKAVQKATEIEVKKILGNKKFKFDRSKITKKIIPYSKKFVSGITTKKLNISSPKSNATYNVRLSQTNLMQLLKNNGMFYSVGAQVKVLPLISYADEIEFKKYFWWGGENPFSSKTGRKVLKNLHVKLEKQLFKNKFSVIRPIKDKVYKKLPMEQHFLKLTPLDVKAIAKASGANIVILGDISVVKIGSKVERYKLNYSFRAVQVEDMKTLATVSSTFKTLPGKFSTSVMELINKAHSSLVSSLSLELKDSWSDGGIGAKIYTITLKGDLKYKQYKAFKKKLIVNIGSVNSINEKSFSPGTIVLELSSPASLSKVVGRLEKSKFSKYKVNISHDSKSSLELDIQSW